ncbi:MAG TPA: hypothetical protein VIL25_04555 [Vicinamibacterales bacterium]
MDIRVPVSLFFAVLGALLAGFGLTTASSPMYERYSLGINLNLWSGLGMLAFAGALYWLARRAARVRSADAVGSDRDQAPRPSRREAGVG